MDPQVSRTATRSLAAGAASSSFAGFNHPQRSVLLRPGFQVDSVFVGGLSVKENAGVLAEEMRTVVLAYVRILRLPYLYFFLGVGGGGMLN